MFVCRSAWQRLAPLAQRATFNLLRNAPVRQMSASSVPGSAGETLPYYLIVFAVAAGGGTYVYRTLCRDKARLHDRHEYIETQLIPQLATIKEDSVTVETPEVSETVEAVEAAVQEATAEEIVAIQEAAAEEIVAIQEAAVEDATEQETVPTTSLEQEQEPPAAEEEPALSAEVSTEQVEQENTEVVVEAAVAETSPVLEASSDNIPEELASATEDWSELSARKPEESVEENSPAAQESEEAVESEAATSS